MEARKIPANEVALSFPLKCRQLISHSTRTQRKTEHLSKTVEHCADDQRRSRFRLWNLLFSEDEQIASQSHEAHGGNQRRTKEIDDTL